MKELKPKSRVIRSKKAGNSPAPTKVGPCGHSHCGDVCRVRYIGPVSNMRDHHILHTARGVSHIWTAAIIAGLAVVLTGAVAYSSVNAANQKHDDQRTSEATAQILGKIQSLEDRLGALENQVQNVSLNQAQPSQANSAIKP
jgi:hypothetical protein